MRSFPHKLKWIPWLLLGIFAAFFIDFAFFFIQCRGFSEQSLLGIDQLKTPKIENEAIVVLTGDRNRIPRAVELLRQRDSKLLLISGGGKGIKLVELVNFQLDSKENMQEIWKKIILESNSTTTIENAIESQKILSLQKIGRVILITSEYHMPRSLIIFRTIAPELEYLPYPTPSELSQYGILHPEKFFDAFLKVFAEYWKLFLFKNYFLHHLNR